MHIYLNQISDLAALIKSIAHDEGSYSLSQIIERLNSLERVNRITVDSSKGILTIHNIAPNISTPVIIDDLYYSSMVTEILSTISSLTGTTCKNLFEAKKALETFTTNTKWRKENSTLIFYN